MVEKKKSPDQKAKESIMALYQTLGKEPWLVARVISSGSLYGAFHADGVSIYKFDRAQPILAQTYMWKDFTSASVDCFVMKAVIVLSGGLNTSTIVIAGKGKAFAELLRSNTSISVSVLDRPWWRKILGFRSRTKWKMIVATIVYLAIFGQSINSSSNTPNSAPAAVSTVKPETTPAPPPVIKTAEEIKAENDKAAAEKVLADAQAIVDEKAAQAKAAKKAYQDWIQNQFSPWDGSNTYLVNMVKKNLNDDKSFSHVETAYSDHNDYIVVKMTYRAKNAFGALILQNITAKSDYKTNTISIIAQNN